MTHQITLHCRNQPDAMERILRTVRHRGFTLEAVNMTSSSCGQQFELAIQVSSSRSPRLLTSQLDKLYDVIQWVLKEKQVPCRVETM